MTAARGRPPARGAAHRMGGAAYDFGARFRINLCPFAHALCSNVYRSTLIHLDSWEPIGHPAASLELQRFGISRNSKRFSSAGLQIIKQKPTVGEKDATARSRSSSRHRHNGGKRMKRRDILKAVGVGLAASAAV